jgi:CrcB protein
MSTPSPRPSPPRVDPDVTTASRRRRSAALDPAVVAVVALGGVLGAETRYALSLWQAPAPDQWPVTTWGINVTGSFLLGVLMVALTELTSPHRLIRLFLGVGVLGGFTTFSTAVVEVDQLVLAGRPWLAVAYLLGTALAALVAVAVGAAMVRGAAILIRRVAWKGARG